MNDNFNYRQVSAKRLRELSIAITGKSGSATLQDLETLLKVSSTDVTKVISNIKKIHKEEAKRVELYEDLQYILNNIKDLNSTQEKFVKDQVKLLIKEIDTIEKKEKATQKYRKSLDTINKVLAEGNKLLQASVKHNQEIYNIAHEMQLAQNITWKEYTELYNKAYDITRKLNQEAGKSIHNSKELVETQNKLLGEGWKGISPTTLTDLSGNVMLMTKTLGSFPAGLSDAFQKSYRMLGDQNNAFITAVGNRLNAFSDTFGLSLSMLSDTVSKMMASNSFIARSNMQMQIKANESLMSAAALSARVGLTSVDFISTLAKTSQYGTMEQMSTLYEGGALLQDFSTESFQKKMIEQDYSGAVTDLVSSIGKTLGGIDDHYLRAEYMQRIGSSFGLSQDDLLMIVNSSDKMGDYIEELTDKLVNVDTSMVDELRDFRMTIVDRIDNWYKSSSFTQGIGSIFQETGIYGLGNSLKSIQTAVWGIAASMFTGISGKSISDAVVNRLAGLTIGGVGGVGVGTAMVSPVATAKGFPLMKVAGATLGIGGTIASTEGGRALQQNIDNSNTGWGGALLSTLGSTTSGAVGGAMVGGLPGAIVGGGAGLLYGGYSAIRDSHERSRLLQEREHQQNIQRQQSRNLYVQSLSQQPEPVVDHSDDNVVNAIEDIGKLLVNFMGQVQGNHLENTKLTFTLATENKTNTNITKTDI